MKNINRLSKISFFILSIVLAFTSTAQSNETKSTKDLDFLIGDWSVTRTYRPSTENERVMKGSLICKESLDGKFINCRYEMTRPGKANGIDEVFFNYNSIYDTYESLWLSSTWPIKVLMQGTLQRTNGKLNLNTLADFEIENGVIEYVKDELILDGTRESQSSFKRETHIRTSNSKDNAWIHHMTEVAEKNS